MNDSWFDRGWRFPPPLVCLAAIMGPYWLASGALQPEGSYGCWILGIGGGVFMFVTLIGFIGAMLRADYWARRAGHE